MPYKYTSLTVSDRETIAEQQVRQFEAEIFGHELNIARLQAIADDTSGEEAAAQQAIDTIAQAVEITVAAVTDLADVPAPVEAPPTK